ncbi:hypothetical protein [Armatimonas sp.]|uniref:hypothetical protein n=1 Tax=Armatimonas sp. TaxID=1872638 RepID=UPI0037533927
MVQQEGFGVDAKTEDDKATEDNKATTVSAAVKFKTGFMIIFSKNIGAWREARHKK